MEPSTETSLEFELANDPAFWNELDGMDGSSHDEWLLTIIGSLMQREATIVAQLEAQARQNSGKGKGFKGAGKGHGGKGRSGGKGE